MGPGDGRYGERACSMSAVDRPTNSSGHGSGHGPARGLSVAGDRAYDAIREIIVSGRVGPGGRLREGEISLELGVSRTPVREAIRRLAAEGFVDFLPNKGALVASWSEQELADIFELRVLLESHAARRAATRITDEHIDRLEELAAAMEAHLGRPIEVTDFRIAQLNNDFHRLILEASSSRLLSTTVQGALHVALVHRTFRRYSKREMQRSFSHHRELIDAMRAGDGDWAESVMRSHILAARDILLTGQKEAAQA